MDLKPHEQRVVRELGELCERLDRLRVFLRSELATRLDSEDLGLMAAQEAAMSAYLRILALRIQRWTGELPVNLSGLVTSRVG